VTATSAKSVVQQRLTAEDAQLQGRIPPGMAWDEDAQQVVPRGELIAAAALERPVDLQRNLEDWGRNRQTLVRFIEQKLEQAKYNAKGYPLAGEMHDYYKLPNYDKKVLTKQGAEKLAQLFRFARATTETVHREIAKDCVTAVVRVVLVDHYRRPVGSGEAACSTAEKAFQGGNASKYNGDMRAALNDVISRAGKRAFVQAVVYAIAGDELFESQAPVAGDDRDDEDVQREAAAAPRFPANWKDVGGTLISDATDAQLAEVVAWGQKARNPAAVQPLVDAVQAEQEKRRVNQDGDQPVL
jgi:hypothetical protein